MSHPDKAAAHKNDPKWVGRLSKDKAIKSDNEAAAINYGLDDKVTLKAATYADGRQTGRKEK